MRRSGRRRAPSSPLAGAPAARRRRRPSSRSSSTTASPTSIGALAILNAHGMHATFYVNSAVDRRRRRTCRGTQLQDLAAAGNEIAGHTLTHANIKKLKTGAGPPGGLRRPGQPVRARLPARLVRVPVRRFDAGAKPVVADCGYNSGRGVSGVNDRKVFAETIPPLDAYATRTPPNPKQGTTLATIEGYVTAAEQNGGGWVQLVFHHLCDQCDAYSITPADFTALLDWLAPRAATGTVVRTTAEVVGGPVQPPVAP